MVYEGTAVSDGAAIGNVFQYRPCGRSVEESFIEAGKVEESIQAYREVLKKAEAELQILAEDKELEEEQRKIFQAHIDIVQDEAMGEEIEEEIRENLFSPEYAVQTVYARYIAVISKAKDALIRERAADLKDVSLRMIRLLSGKEENGLASLPGDVILIAHDLLPSDTAAMQKEHVLAIVTEIGGYTSHMAILARNYGIPAVLGVPDILIHTENGEKIAVDAHAGKVLTNLTQAQEKQYQVMRDEYLKKKNDMKQYIGVEPVTADGTKIEVCLNIGSADKNELELEKYTDGVGLFRTEFLYMSKKKLPTEEEQFAVYKKVAEIFGERQVIIRTLDIGGDKKLDYLELPQEDNPFLGLRALRLCFEMKPIFKTQLRAILRAGYYGNIWIMFPMVGSIGDIRFAKEIVQEVRDELEEEKIPYGRHVKVGIMVEIPSIALMADIAASEVDFASIGTNDLCQYLMAVDRLNPSVAKYYQSFHPAMFRLIKQIVEAFTRQGKPVSVCGEMGGNPQAVALLAGLGIRKFSMNASSIASVKKMISQLNICKAQRMSRTVLELSTAVQVENYLNSEFLE
ncbi:phosphoenolpyruvate--protein phosphotransferase [Faecalicatena acetigenes]|uniref:Phosphoenolpyruvate-protein phosphotransferase n=2 Tax=Lachnospiraceae TaxID=186803 RepID=A0ABT2TF21_9FIRM|nr:MULTISPECIES: phosphoenolpyruvate--protein phosphotransferase [Lachnospiraceae]MCU6748407.1 phosphoenolpyruvate--protein phosphotransferase [Faecalicatena acetigenes]RGT72430.1 phosphoenolpyruvate--protein phosphotransferase [Ruminococcus sp. AF18-22]SCI42633.1 Phosphoenolpyruvate-protein phosphotransferase [uncultured Clostridium sp.]